MKIRSWLNAHSTAATAVFVIVLVASVASMLWPSRPNRGRRAVQSAFFYDLGTGQLFVAPGNQFPPIEAPSGGRGARAYVYACGDCGDPSARFIGYLESYTPRGQEELVKAGGKFDARMLIEVEIQERLVCDPNVDPTSWFSMATEEGMAIPERWQNRCGGGPVTLCHPGDFEP